MKIIQYPEKGGESRLILRVLVILFLVSSANATISITPSVRVIKLSTTFSDTATLTLSVSDAPADIILTWSNFAYTTLDASKTSWTNFQGIDTILINITRTSQENKSRRFELNFTSTTPGANDVSVVVETRIKSYPHLLFNNITETPGYKYSTKNPWSTWKWYIHIKRLSGAVSGAMDHLIYGTTDGLNYSKNAMLNFQRTPGDGRNIYRVWELEHIVYAYDFAQPYLTDSEDIIIRGKIAELADQIYYDLNHYGGGSSEVIQCVDYHLQAYPTLGIAGILLSDYVNSTLDHGSSPEDWISVGTEYLFVSDPLHTRGGSMFSSCINSEGVDLLAGDYRGYYYDELINLAQVYSHYYNRSILDDYPILYKWVVAPLWYYMPNKYDTNRAAGGHVKYEDARMWMNLLDATNKSYMWKYYNELMNDKTLPYSRTFGMVADYHPMTEMAFSIYENYSDVQYAVPDTTSRFTDSDYQVFRSGWENTSTWLSFTTFRSSGTENRFLFHDDQLSFEYYDKGDYLLADSGEVKYRKRGYGPIYAKGHNVIMISESSDSNLAGAYKGVNYVLMHKASLDYLSNDNFEFVESSINFTKLETTNSKGERINNDLITINPLEWKRSILYPNKEYFIVLDYLNNSNQRRIDTLFHLTSFKHAATTSSFIANVYGNLSIEGSKVEWDTQTYNVEMEITNGRELRWNTSNVYNTKLQTHLYSVPGSEISVEKFWARIGGFGLSSEVDHPLVRYKLNTADNLYRITSFYTRYLTENEKTFTELSTTGTGSALKIESDSDIEDIVSLSNGGLIIADKMKTDARIGFCRSNNSRLDYFFINEGQEFSYDDTLVFNSSEELMANLRFRSDRVYGHLSGDGYYTVAIKTGFNSTNISSVKFNGEDVEYTYLTGNMFLTLNGKGDLDIRSEGTDLMVSSEHIFFPPGVWEGSYVNISAKVWNTGGLDAGSFVVQFLDGTQEIDTREISSLVAGDSIVESVLWYASPGGEHEIRVIVDPNDDVTNELNEDNNIGSRSLYVSYQADLGLNMTDISFSKNLPVEGEEILVYVDINNDGGENVTDVIVQCFDGAPSAGNQIGNKTVDVERTSEVRVNFTWTAQPAWTHGIYIVLDPLNTVNESNEGNNLAYRLIYVQTKADLVLDPEDIQFTPEEPVDGDSVLITAKVRNTGEANANSFTVRFLNGGYTIGEENTGVTGNNNISVNTTWTATPEGMHNIFILLDLGNTVNESAEGNNDANTSVYVHPAAGTTTTTSSTSTTTMAGNTSTTSTSSTSTTTLAGETTSTTSTSTTSTTLPQWEPMLVVGGGRGDENGELYEPVDVTVDINGSIYVLERYNERIQKFDENGAFKEIYGEAGSSGLGEFDSPGGITIREVNATITRLFIADTDNHRIQIMTNELRTTQDNDTILNTSWQAFGERCYEDCVPWVYIYFEDPWGVDVDDSGRIYVADTGNNRISIIYDLPADLSKVPTPHNRTDLNGFNEPKAVLVKDDRIYVADTGNNQVKILNLTGSEINSINGLNEPSSIALDSEDNIYVADTLNSRIMIFSPQGFYITEFGEENCSVHIYNDPEAAAGQFCMPEGIEIKGEKIYVADTGNHRIQVFETRELPPATCLLPGDYPPCGEISLSEVVDYLNQWSQGQASLAEVINLINAWAGG